MQMTNFHLSIKKTPASILVYRICVVMLLFTASRIVFFLLNRGLFTQVDFKYFIKLSLAGLRFDLTALLYFNVVYILLMAIPHKLHHKRFFIKYTNLLFYITNGVALFINSIDFVYYRFTSRRTTLMVFEEFSNEQNFLQLLYHFAIDYFYVLLIYIALMFILVYATRKQVIQKSKHTLLNYLLINIPIMVIILTLTVIGARGGLPPKQDFPLNPSDACQYTRQPKDVAIVLNSAFTMLLSADKPKLEKQNYYHSKKKLEAVYSPIHCADSSRRKQRLNVFIIMVESLGREPIGFYNPELENGNYSGYTPFLDSLCKQSLVFKNSYANSRISIEGSPAVIASIPSIQESFTVSQYWGNKIMSLASCLKKTGYQSTYFHGAPNGSLGLNSFAKAAGFDNYVGKKEYNNDADYDGVWGIWDHKFLPFAASSTREDQQPFFNFIFTVSSHHPFKIPDSLQDEFKEGTENIHRSISYTDYSLKEFFKVASEKPWFDSTIFVITGDHTCMAHYPKFKTDIGIYTVPIIFYLPGKNLKGINLKTAQQIDIMPTILNYLGYPEPYFAFGQDLFEENPNKFAISYVGNSYQILQNDWVLQFDLKKSIGLYNIKYDPTMKFNLLGSFEGIQKHLENQVKAFIQQYHQHMIDDDMTVN